MHIIYVSKKKYPLALRRRHSAAVLLWKAKGSKGSKPKLYQIAESVLEVGLNHIDSIPSVDRRASHTTSGDE